MKYCPRCKSTFTDETLRFCLQDGTGLLSVGSGSASVDSVETLHFSSTTDNRSEPTLVLPAESESVPGPTVAARPAAETVRQRFTSARTKLERKPRNLALVIVLTILATVIVLAVLGGGYLLLFGRDQNRAGDEANTASQPPADKTASPSPTQALTPTPTPKASPTPNSEQEAAIRSSISNVLDGWVAASRARDASANIAFYAATLNPYFNRPSYPASKVRDERARIYEMYQTVDIEITNLKVTPDASGNTAIATFDKTWTFESTEKFSSGSVRAQMWFAKSGGRWLITGEKDLKVYYLNKK